MRYEKTVPFTAEPAAALEIAKTTLLPSGFQITETAPNSITLKGNIFFWSQMQNNPLLGASGVNIQIDNSTISLKAELGTITKVIIFLTVFIAGMAVLMTTIFALTLGKTEAGPNVILLSLLPLAPWPVLAPIILFFLKARTCKALDILLSNMTGQQNF